MSTEWWSIINRACTIENCAYVVACNQASTLKDMPVFRHPRGSMVVDYEVRILARAQGNQGQIVIDPIHLGALREFRIKAKAHIGIAHLRCGAFYPGGEAPSRPSANA
ncbi:MAG: nitrilase-related carbon-nitrogen hydrolase [Thermoproteota archaeon]